MTLSELFTQRAGTDKIGRIDSFCAVTILGVIRMDVNLQSVDIDQCSTEDSWFADSHQCDVNSTEISAKVAMHNLDNGQSLSTFKTEIDRFLIIKGIKG
eukprot:g34109.t1